MHFLYLFYFTKGERKGKEKEKGKEKNLKGKNMIRNMDNRLEKVNNCNDQVANPFASQLISNALRLTKLKSDLQLSYNYTQYFWYIINEEFLVYNK